MTFKSKDVETANRATWPSIIPLHLESGNLIDKFIDGFLKSGKVCSSEVYSRKRKKKSGKRRLI